MTEWITMIAEIISAMAALGLLYIASQWKKQAFEKKRLETKEAILVDFNALRKLVEDLACPIVTEGRDEILHRKHDCRKARDQVLKHAMVLIKIYYIERINLAEEIINLIPAFTVEFPCFENNKEEIERKKNEIVEKIQALEKLIQ